MVNGGSGILNDVLDYAEERTEYGETLKVNEAELADDLGYDQAEMARTLLDAPDPVAGIGLTRTEDEEGEPMWLLMHLPPVGSSGGEASDA